MLAIGDESELCIGEGEDAPLTLARGATRFAPFIAAEREAAARKQDERARWSLRARAGMGESEHGCPRLDTAGNSSMHT